jgi:hypothetical protein
MVAGVAVMTWSTSSCHEQMTEDWRLGCLVERHGMCGDDKFGCLYSKDGDLQRCCYGHEQELGNTCARPRA